MNLKRHMTTGLSRIELVVLVAMLGLVIVCVMPMLIPHSGAAKKARRISCISNLHMIGLAARIYKSDHEENFPWMVSTNFNSTNTSGSREFTNSPQVFHHFQSMSNELSTPKILHCPSDEQRARATYFPNLSNANLSYFVSPDADETDPNRLLSGDRNITGGFPSKGFLRVFTPASAAGWTSELHNRAGNIALADGGVLQVTEQALSDQLKAQSVSAIRLLIP